MSDQVEPQSETKPENQCLGCGTVFPSRNAIFKHLRDTEGVCLEGKERQDFLRLVRSKEKGVKVLLLFGYIPHRSFIQNGDDAARILMKACHQWQANLESEGQPSVSGSPSQSEEELEKFSRSYGQKHRGVDVVAQDDGTGAVTEVLATRLKTIKGGRNIDQWIDEVQDLINQQVCQDIQTETKNEMINSTKNTVVPCVRLLGRQDIPQAKTFNAEMDYSHRRIEYLLPVDFLSSFVSNQSLKQKLETLVPFSENHKHNLHHSHESVAEHRADSETRIFLARSKRLMQSLSTQVIELDQNDKAAIMEKGFNVSKRKGNAKRSRNGKKVQETADENTEVKSHFVADQQRLLKRKRFHNFTPRLMAHEYLAYRRLDRVYHRATLTFPDIDPTKKPFLVLSMRGDLFLKGQACRIIGVFLAIATGLIEKDILDCIFDEDYPHLIPTPPAPLTGLVAGEANYMSWEGKLKSILTPRNTDRYANGWNNIKTMEMVKDWQDTVHKAIAQEWLSKGRDAATGRLVAEQEWTETILIPWVKTAKIHLKDYQQWRKTRALGTSVDMGVVEAAPKLVPPIDSIDASVPDIFQKVLFHLRKVDQSGQWPSTTLKRQLVMITTAETEEAKEGQSTSLAMARYEAVTNSGGRSSAYSFAEGQGGASGSFSVGLMPGIANKQPKSNFLFPELVQAAFELERLLCPDREPSSTIAINRNAQFRPHTDSGAGAGQSTSLIVGLGTYSGGELMVEGEKRDIRYKAIEFNGWKQRHWTLPFNGERYSLVWFTPKGCEGMRGIDLDLSAAAASETQTTD